MRFEMVTLHNNKSDDYRSVGRCKMLGRPGQETNAPLHFIFFFTILCQNIALKICAAKSDKQKKKPNKQTNKTKQKKTKTNKPHTHTHTPTNKQTKQKQKTERKEIPEDNQTSNIMYNTYNILTHHWQYA